ncbi:integrase catalytic domain-containing protein [Trichonephila clavipes]|nr:integrase catalytic domain-containing protein [Trichonephila clavipes]
MQPDEKVSGFLSTEEVYWKFISPNFGGIWKLESSLFNFMQKELLALSLEEFLTITVQIEGILNSRPLIPLSVKVENFEVLTPGHFLIGRALNAIVEPDLCAVNTNKLDKYRKINKILQNI